MSEISICTCNVALAGDIKNTVTRGPTRPVTWPEVEVLQYIHGDDAVTDIVVIDKGDTTILDEYERLTLRYGKQVTATLFPGKRPAMQLKAPQGIERKKAETATADPFEGAKE